VTTTDLNFTMQPLFSDPKRDDCTYPYDELCGCGIGFKLIQAGSQPKPNTEDLIPYLI
jgi:single-stranded-DNA-specific exonuclease